MENKKMVVNTELDMLQYVNCIENIVSKFFNDEFDYEPYIGMLHTMCIFYNLCVKDSKFKESVGDEVHEVWDIRDVAKDDEFIKEFNKAIREQDDFRLNFNNAYKQAMDIVENKKNPINSVLDLIKDFGVGYANSLNELLDIGGVDTPEVETNIDNPEDISVAEG